MVGDELGPHCRIRRAQDPLDVAEGDLEFSQPVDDLCRRDLVHGVVPVAARAVDARRLEQAGVVVAAKGAHAQVRELGELADRQHPAIVNAPPGGESNA